MSKGGLLNVKGRVYIDYKKDREDLPDHSIFKSLIYALT
jgi:hypothetical protein